MWSPVTGGGSHGACGASVLIGVPSRRQRSGDRMVVLHDVGPGDEVRVLGELSDAVHGRTRDVDLEQEVDPLLLGASGEDAGQLPSQLQVAAGVLAELFAQVTFEQVLTFDGATEPLEEVPLRGLEQDGAVVGSVVVLVPHRVAHRRAGLAGRR